jgi:hypothetical protein
LLRLRKFATPCSGRSYFLFYLFRAVLDFICLVLSKIELHLLSPSSSHCLSNSVNLLLYAIFSTFLPLNVIDSFLFWALLDWGWESACLAEFMVLSLCRKSHICTKRAARHVQNRWFRLRWGEVPMASDRKPNLFGKGSTPSSDEFLKHGFYFWLH